MKKQILILVVFTLFGCNKSEELAAGTIISREFTFSVFDANNQDLLDSSITNHYDADEIKLFYEIDGKVIEVFDPEMAHPRNFKIYKHENEYRIMIYMNSSETSTEPITYIQWRNNDIDTIKAFFERPNNGSIFKRKVWLNNVQVWEWSSENDIGYFKLIKQLLLTFS